RSEGRRATSQCWTRDGRGKNQGAEQAFRGAVGPGRIEVQGVLITRRSDRTTSTFKIEHRPPLTREGRSQQRKLLRTTLSRAYSMEQRSEHVNGNYARLGIVRAWMRRREDLGTMGAIDFDPMCNLRKLA